MDRSRDVSKSLIAVGNKKCARFSRVRCDAAILSVDEDDELLDYLPIDDERGCLLRCRRRAGVQLLVVDVDRERASLVLPSGASPLTLQTSIPLADMPRCWLLAAASSSSTQKLLVETAAIDVASGLFETPRALLFEIVGARFRCCAAFDLLYGGIAAPTLSADGASICYFARGNAPTTLIEMRLSDGEPTLRETSGFPFGDSRHALSNVSEQSAIVLCSSRQFSDLLAQKSLLRHHAACSRCARRWLMDSH